MSASPVTFRPAADGREIAVLGVVDVGEIGISPNIFRSGLCYWRLWLPFCSQMGRATCPRAAREHLTARIEQWIEAAGLAPTAREEIRAFRDDANSRAKTGEVVRS